MLRADEPDGTPPTSMVFDIASTQAVSAGAGRSLESRGFTLDVLQQMFALPSPPLLSGQMEVSLRMVACGIIANTLRLSHLHIATSKCSIAQLQTKSVKLLPRQGKKQ